MTTNAAETSLATFLADARVGTFTGLITRKAGVERGSKDAKVRYGDDEVHVCIFTGFNYTALVQRSLDALDGIDLGALMSSAQAKGLKGWVGRGKNAVETDLTAQDFEDAAEELRDSFQATLDGTNESTTDAVFEPLVVDGETVRGCRVYKGQTDAAIERGDKAPATPGTVYLQGLQVSSRVVTPAPNGPVPASQSAPKTIAKDMIRRTLPISRYVSYKLEPGGDYILRAGGAAIAQAEKSGVITTEITRAVAAAL